MQMPAKVLVRHVDNSSMNGPETDTGDSINFGKNPNVMTLKTLQRVADQFSGGFHFFGATGMVACPSERRWGTPREWCNTYLKVIQRHLQGEEQVRMQTNTAAVPRSVDMQQSLVSRLCVSYALHSMAMS